MVCTPVLPRAQLVTDPVVIFEILSGSTASSDLVVRNAEYRETPSVGRYVILQQTSAAAIVFSHRGGEWATDIVAGTDAVLSLPEIGIELPLNEIYADIVFPTEADDTPS